MKIFNFVFAVMAATLAIYATGCSDNVQDGYSDNVSAVECDDAVTRSSYDAEAQAYAELNEELMQLSEVYPPEIMARAINLKYFGAAVLADVIGACIGGGTMFNIASAVVTSVTCSGLAYRTTKAIDNYPELRVPTLTTLDPNINMLTVLGQVEYTGYLHNLILSEVVEELGVNITVLPEEHLKLCVLEKTVRYFSIPAEERYNFMVDSTLNQTIADVVEDFDDVPSNVILNRVLSVCPNRSNEMAVVNTFCHQYNHYASQNTKDSYANDFINVVRNSSVSLNSKNYIISAVSVANQSDKFWVPVSVND